MQPLWGCQQTCIRTLATALLPAMDRRAKIVATLGPRFRFAEVTGVATVIPLWANMTSWVYPIDKASHHEYCTQSSALP